MSYETQLIVVEDYTNSCNTLARNGVCMGSEIARINMRDIGGSHLSNLRDKKKQENGHFWGFYSDNGETIIKEDRYGEKLIAIPIKELVGVLYRDCSERPYRRFHFALPLFKGIQSTFNEDEIFVIWYGY